MHATQIEGNRHYITSVADLALLCANLISLMMMAVSTAQSERSFSALKRIKSYLRSTMGEQRLIDLAVLAVERELSSRIQMSEVLEEFKNNDKNRKITLFQLL